MVKPGKTEKWAARNARLSAALRENLKRRKAQARGRAAQPASTEAFGPQDAKNASDAPDFRPNPGRESGGGSGERDK